MTGGGPWPEPLKSEGAGISSMKKLNVASFGVGVIGSQVAKFVLEERQNVLNLVGAYDIDPTKVGRDVGEVVGLGRLAGVRVSDDLGGVLGGDVDAIIHTTTSFLKGAYPQLESVLARGVDVVSSCEELSYPYAVDVELSEKLDKLAKKSGATVLGTGINPGFLMDALPLMLTAPCKSIRKIIVSRKMNAGTRRVPFQKKVGAGMTPDEFGNAIHDGRISGHVGLEESVSMLAAGVGWPLDGVEVSKAEPVIAESEVDGYVKIPRGGVAGVKQEAIGVVGGESRIELRFTAYVGAEDEHDEVVIDGTPPVNCRISPCVHGDHGTIAMLVNMVPKVVSSPPGLLTMKDVQLPSASL